MANYYDLYKRLLIAQADNMIEETPEKIQKINQLYGAIMDLNPPIVMGANNSENTINQKEIAIEKVYQTLEEQGIKGVREMTVFQFEVSYQRNQEEITRLEKAHHAAQ